MTKLTEKVLQHGDRVWFDPADSHAPSRGQSLGRAEFAVCLEWRDAGEQRRLLNTVWIWPLQQRDVQHYYKVIPPHSDAFSVSSWTRLGEEPRVWMHTWCSEHHCQSMRVYVPSQANCFEIMALSTTQMMFSNEQGI